VIRMCSQGARDVHLAAQDRLKAFRLALLPVLDRPEHVAEVGERDGFHPRSWPRFGSSATFTVLTRNEYWEWTWSGTNSVTEAPSGYRFLKRTARDCVGAAERRAANPLAGRKSEEREESPVSPQIHRPCPGPALLRACSRKAAWIPVYARRALVFEGWQWPSFT